MKKVYISSTFKDLNAHREAASNALRKIGYDVIRMEEYVARDMRTVDACEADVAACDIYVGLFAWRYGYIPEDDNEARRSITEIEYRKAVGEKTCLVFLLSDDAPWPSTLRDAETGDGDDGARIRALRNELKKYAAGFFSTPHELAVEVIAAVYQHESTVRVQQLDVLNEIKESTDLGPSYLPNIQSKLVESQHAGIVEINLGPIPWWTTRLHLVAALASDFTRIRQFLFLDETGDYVSMATPGGVRRALTQRFPHLERAYLASRTDAPPAPLETMQEIDQIIMAYPEQLFQTCDNRVEREVKQDVTPLMLLRDLGIEPSAEAFDRGNVHSSLLQWEILRRKTPFVVLLKKGKLSSVVDRVQMASDIAVQAIGERVH